MTKIEPRPPAQLYPTLLRGKWKGSRGEGRGKEMKRGNILFMEKGNGASLPEFIETRGAGCLEWSCLQSCKAIIFQNNISWMYSIHTTLWFSSQWFDFISGSSRTLCHVYTFMVTIWLRCNVCGEVYSVFSDLESLTTFTCEICVIIFCHVCNITIWGLEECITFPCQMHVLQTLGYFWTLLVRKLAACLVCVTVTCAVINVPARSSHSDQWITTTAWHNPIYNFRINKNDQWQITVCWTWYAGVTGSLQWILHVYIKFTQLVIMVHICKLISSGS